MVHGGIQTEEVIYLPYSFYSTKGYEAVIEALHKMGYSVAKCYPEDEPKSMEEACRLLYSSPTIPAIEDPNQGKRIKELQDLLHRKNMQLDAMDWVWCSGGCETGLHRYNDLPPLTEEMVQIAERNTERLRRYWENLKYREGDGK